MCRWCAFSLMSSTAFMYTGQIRPSAHWQWGSFVKIKCRPLSNPLRTGTSFLILNLCWFFIDYCYSHTCFFIVNVDVSLCRYIYYFGGLLSGAIKMNSSPLFLHQVLIPTIPGFQEDGGEWMFSWHRSLTFIYKPSMRSCVSVRLYSFVKRNLLHIHTHISSLF